MPKSVSENPFFIYCCPRCHSSNVTIRKPRGYCHNCDYVFDTDDAPVYHPED